MITVWFSRVHLCVQNGCRSESQGIDSFLFLFLGLNRENFLNLYNLSLKACPFLSLHSIFNNTLDVTESSSGNIKDSNSKLMFAGLEKQVKYQICY